VNTIADRFARCAKLAALILGLGLQAGAGAADVVVVVSARSAISSLSRSEVADIFLGRAQRFPDGAPAVPIDLAEGSDIRDAFYSTIADRTPAQVKAQWSKIIFTGRGMPPEAVGDSAQVKRRLGADPNAIGYLDRAQTDASVRVLMTK